MQVCDADVFRTSRSILRLLRGYGSCVLTPNLYELSLMEKEIDEIERSEEASPIGGQKSDKNVVEDLHVYSIRRPSFKVCNPPDWNRVVAVARKMKGPIIFVKGSSDIITDGTAVMVSSIEGSQRRCGKMQYYENNWSLYFVHRGTWGYFIGGIGCINGVLSSC